MSSNVKLNWCIKLCFACNCCNLILVYFAVFIYWQNPVYFWTYSRDILVQSLWFKNWPRNMICHFVVRQPNVWIIFTLPMNEIGPFIHWISSLDFGKDLWRDITFNSIVPVIFYTAYAAILILSMHWTWFNVIQFSGNAT